MGEWNEVILEDVVSVLGDGLHGTPNYDDNGDYYFINGNNLSDGKIVIKDSTKRANKIEYEKYKKDLNDRTILVSINGTIGNVALYNNEKCILGKSACYFNVVQEVDKHFIKYVVTNKNFQEYIHNFANGTTIKNVSLNTMREYPFLLPPLPEQKSIASILSSLDDKIDLLHRQNKTLEALAETLFRQWFVEPVRRGGEADESWEVGKLGDVIELNYGKGLKEEIRTGIGYQVVGSNGVVGFHNDFLVEGPGIVIGRKGTLGKVIYLYENFYPIDTTYYVKTKVNSRELLFEYFLLKLLNFEDMNSDSAVPGLNREIALSTELSIPPENKINSFNRIASTLFQKIKFNLNQILTLTQLRDTLLPKLMSGEVRVKMSESEFTGLKE